MKNWFLKLKEHSQLILIILAMSFSLAFMDKEVRGKFFDVAAKALEVICQASLWQ